MKYAYCMAVFEVLDFFAWLFITISQGTTWVARKCHEASVRYVERSERA